MLHGATLSHHAQPGCRPCTLAHGCCARCAARQCLTACARNRQPHGGRCSSLQQGGQATNHPTHDTPHTHAGSHTRALCQHSTYSTPAQAGSLALFAGQPHSEHRAPSAEATAWLQRQPHNHKLRHSNPFLQRRHQERARSRVCKQQHVHLCSTPWQQKQGRLTSCQGTSMEWAVRGCPSTSATHVTVQRNHDS